MGSKKGTGYIEKFLKKADKAIEDGVKRADEVLEDAVELGVMAASQAKKTSGEFRKQLLLVRYSKFLMILFYEGEIFFLALM